MNRKQLRARVRKAITSHRNTAGGISPMEMTALTDDLLDIVEEAAGMVPPKLFYSITMQWGVGVVSHAGSYDLQSHETRLYVFQDLLDQMFGIHRKKIEEGAVEEDGLTVQEGVILHFTLESNSFAEG